MSAADHTSSDQFVDVYHANRRVFDLPPHERTPFGVKGPEKDAIFAGTLKSSEERMSRVPRGHEYQVHHYRVPQSLMSGEVWGDDFLASGYNRVHDRAGIAGDNPGLWEGIPVNPGEAAQRNVVTRYRNMVEDEGSISVVMPRHLIASGKIQYMGASTIKKK